MMKLFNFNKQENTAPPAGQHASISTLSTFRNIISFLGLATLLFTTVLLMFDYKEINQIVVSSGNKTAETYNAEKKKMLTNGALLLTSAFLMIGHAYYSRAVLILLMVVEDGAILIMRAKQSVSYHFELMWLIILNLLVGVVYMRTIWLDSRFHSEWICTALLKDRCSGMLEEESEGEETSSDSKIQSPKTGGFLDKLRSKINNFLKPRKRQSSQINTSAIGSGISSTSLVVNRPTNNLSSSGELSSEEEDHQDRSKIKHTQKPSKAHNKKPKPKHK